MKALKLWGWTLFAAAAGLFAYGALSGEFNEYGLWGTSQQAQWLSGISLVCLLLAVTVGVIFFALRDR